MNLKKEYVLCWKYLKESKSFVFAVIGIFVASAIFGVAFSDKLTILNQVLKQIIENTQGMNTLQLVVYIFFNNLKASLYAMLGGLFFGIYPILNALSNGTVIGYVLSLVYEKTGFSEFWRILPHGIFELPAVFISLGLGIRTGMFWFSTNKGKEFVYNSRMALKTFFLIVVPLLIIAAIIEGILIGITK